jgi:hypothetical protein
MFKTMLIHSNFTVSANRKSLYWLLFTSWRNEALAKGVEKYKLPVAPGYQNGHRSQFAQ